NTETGETETRQFDLSEFTHVAIGSAFSYEIKQSDTYSISIMANNNLFDDIKVAKEGQTLKIRMELPGVPWAIFNIDTGPKVFITMPQLYGMNSSGATNGTVSRFSSTDDLDFTVSGASSVELLAISAGNVSFHVSGASIVSGDIKAEDIALDVSGAGSVQLEGSASDTEIEASGASHLKLASLTVNDADIMLSGASDCTLNLSGRLDTKLSGVSTLEYIGEPTLGKMDITGASTLKKK
ncbi:GIN domain-containing protein, partial [Candidatus Omnitrophota bacterium]